MILRRSILTSLLAGTLLAYSAAQGVAAPKRLVIALDGISYRHMKPLQEGFTYTNRNGKVVFRQAFHRGYFPVSRNISTFPSASDVAWSEILGNRPVPGYQRTYYRHASNDMGRLNGVTSSLEFEKQMTWRMESGFLRAMSFLYGRRTYRYEVREGLKSFLADNSTNENFYLYIYSSDPAQHLSHDLFEMLCELDRSLENVRAKYRAREGRELEILILSDHGNNGADQNYRVQVWKTLQEAGYRISSTIQHPRDVVLPTVGIESWVEVQNHPSETENLLRLLHGLAGVDIISARDPARQDRFVVMNARGDRASILFDPARNALAYQPETGDPLNYVLAAARLRDRRLLDSQGFAKADDWMEETMVHPYPLALERIVRGHTAATLNPANILISLENGYVHASWGLKKGSELVRLGGTHGGLSRLDSEGIVLSNFVPTRDTSATRVAEQFGGFPDMKDYRAHEIGAEWFTPEMQQRVRLPRMPLDRGVARLETDGVYLRVWAPVLNHSGESARLRFEVREQKRYSEARLRRWELEKPAANGAPLELTPLPEVPRSIYERVYCQKPGTRLPANRELVLTGYLQQGNRWTVLFTQSFWTDEEGKPLPF